MSIATSWGVTAAERDRAYPCDDLPREPGYRLLRGVDVAAPPDVVYRWVSQLRAAPYSYDWIDNGGRRSPRRPLPWCWDLQVGQVVAKVFTIASFVPDEHLTLRVAPGVGTRAFGDIALSYVVVPVGPTRSRLLGVVRGGAPAGRPLARRFLTARDRLLAWGDLVMMRKQLRTFAALAEAEHARRADAQSSR
ncbi:SRPBCC family protein [Cellulomonas fengjieae]|uniref:SRPBCC family protein n=1 Tax=Cellulomonas fengjieae TaxID=2819978 RepID=UPI001FBAFF81|nr:SRPBCC family protein [Cellulomonas fengjieae]